MTQEELDHIYADIRVHGKKVEGWSCDEQGDGHVLRDNKRRNFWERPSPGEAWVERGMPSAS